MSAPVDRDDAPVLVVEGLACRRGERVLFRPVDLSVRAGQIVWVRGANGQGKTTLLRTLAGLCPADAGSIAWAKPERRFVYLAHANALKEDLTVAEALNFLLRIGGERPTAGEVTTALERFAMSNRADAPVRTLSQGQRRRVALARLAHEREAATWLLDEPFDALDAAGIKSLNSLLVAHARRGGSVVLTSHVPLAIETPLPIVVMLEAPVAAAASAFA